MHRNSNRGVQWARQLLRFGWLALIIAGFFFYLFNRELFTRETIAALLLQYRQQVWLVYFGICILRGLLLLPSTPFLLAGMLLFKDTPLLLFLVFLLTVFIVSTFIYYAAGYLKGSFFSGKNTAARLERIKEQLNGKRGFWLILGWAFTPFTPTDLVCYAAGLLRLRFWQFILPLLLGEAIICGIYIYNGVLLLP
ncbi:TVP38/TMEM64 family protein [Niabella beijingensis]|uniref:TVP38/TMEM64 family protein n=1 Tax=Niabella beijingensis TaxID=2872700 RepID=UPI001CBD5E1C|nr:VTT domain-containing protein [Niabella beijingensis]MBZ4191296.1 VTT domain-containing protein [Niabella beijingensis]